IVLAATGFAADVPPWEDLTYRKEFNQLMTDGRLAEAAASARAILAKAEKDHGPDSIQAALALDVLTELYFYSDYVRDPEAEQIAARAIALKEKILGADHPQVAVSLRLTGELFNVKADYERARPLFERAVAIHEKTAGSDPRQEAYGWQALGTLLTSAGEFAQARVALDRTMAIRDRYFEKDTLNTATALHHSAVLHREVGEYHAAQTEFLRALSIFETKMGVDHV